LNRLYRWEAQGMILRMLAELLAARRPAPEALGLLADASGTPDAIRPVLGRARSAIARGEPLPHALYEAGLLPGSMTPLVESSERLHTLPLALGELGDVLSGKAVRIARRVSLVVGPLLVVGVGAVVGFIAIAMFVPLLQLLSRLAE
jgi:type IV pilus assembly protein PilC